MKYLHIFSGDRNQKFSLPYVNFINNKFDSRDHFFLITLGKGHPCVDVKISNVKVIPYNINIIFKIVKSIYKYDMIIIHGLENNKYVDIALCLQPWLLKKCKWVIWGGDLYYYRMKKNKSLKEKVHEYFRSKIIKNMGGLITQIKGDYQLARKWYGAKGEYYYCFGYLSNLYKNYDLDITNKDNNIIHIQIGNSGDPSSNHLEIFKKLKKYRHSNIEIICPLSYGEPKYISLVIEEGNKIFGQKFIPLTKFLPIEEYLKILNKMDVAIFNSEKQQGVGNITSLIGMGKKVYIRNDTTIWDFCIDHELKVFSSNDDFEDLLEEIDQSLRNENIRNVKEKFSEHKLREDWEKIFN